MNIEKTHIYKLDKNENSPKDDHLALSLLINGKQSSESINNVTKQARSKVKFFDRIKGSLFGLLFSLSMCMSHVFVKMSPSLNGSNHSLIRYLIQIIVMLIFIRKNKLNPFGLKSQRKLLFFRGLVGGSAVILTFFSIQYLDVSDVETIINSSFIMTAIFARFFLKEKITVFHLISLLFTIFGVLFIFRPSFLFEFETDIETIFQFNSSSINNTHIINNNLIKDHSNRKFTDSLIGISLILMSAVCISLAQITLKKLCSFKINFSITTLYPALVGIPASLMLSFILYETNPNKVNFNLLDQFFLIQLFYSICGGLCGTMGAIFLHHALKHEDATRIGIVRTFGVFFSFILQYILLDIEIDFLGILGALFIVTATTSLMILKIWDENLSKSKNFLIRVFFKKF